MTRARRTDAERRALTVPCRLCGAHAATWCHTVWTRRPGGWASALHVERLVDGASDGKLPIEIGSRRG